MRLEGQGVVQFGLGELGHTCSREMAGTVGWGGKQFDATAESANGYGECITKS